MGKGGGKDAKQCYEKRTLRQKGLLGVSYNLKNDLGR